MLTTAQLVEQYQISYGKLPSPKWLSVAARIPLYDAEKILGQGVLFETEQTPTPATQETPRAVEHARSNLPTNPEPANVEGNQPAAENLIGNITKWIVLGFATMADLGLAIFFYWSLGFDLPSKIALGIWGFVMTSGKVWAWTNRRYVLAAWSAALSIVATVSVFLAVIDTQSASVQTATVNESVQTLKSQIAGKEADNATLRARIAETPADYVSAVDRMTKAIAENDKILAQMRQELTVAVEVKPKEAKFELDAWKIFSQLTNFAWNDPSHIFALCLVLAIATLFEMLIYATAPRRMN